MTEKILDKFFDIYNNKSFPLEWKILIKEKENQRPKYTMNYTRYYNFLIQINNILCEITIAVKTNKKKTDFVAKPVICRTENHELFINEIEMIKTYSGWIYRVEWYNERLSKKKYWYGEDLTIQAGWFKLPDIHWNKFKFSNIENLESLFDIERFKYCAYQLNCGNLIDYIEKYKENPKMELFAKAGLGNYIYSKKIWQKCQTDKNFINYMRKNIPNVNTETILYAYKNNIEISEANIILETRHFLTKNNYYQYLKNNLIKIAKYLNEQKINKNSYLDYIKACIFLKLDLELNKNIIPKNFKYWHDIRINQYASNTNKELNKEMLNVVKKYFKYEFKNKDYIAILAKNKQQLIYEGSELSHCVGKMDYDNRIAKEKSLIFFIRKNKEIEKPYVTVEYNIGANKINQCYGIKDSKPIKEVENFVYNDLMEHINKEIKKTKKVS